MATLREVISQYSDSPNLKGYILVFLQEALVAADTINDLIDIFDIDRAEGKHLDLIGRIVGQYERPWYDTTNIPWFSFGDGSGGDASLAGFNNGRLWDGRTINLPGNPNLVVAEDDIYRMFIKTKIYKNSTDGTVQNILDALEVVTGRNDIRIDNANDGTMSINIVGDLTPVGDFEKVFIENYDLLPMPAGVEIASVT